MQLCLVDDGNDCTDSEEGRSVRKKAPSPDWFWMELPKIRSYDTSWLFEQLDTNFNFVIKVLVVLAEGRVRQL